MRTFVCDSKEATMTGSVYGGCSTFAFERVTGQCVYEFQMCNLKDFS